MKSIKDGVAIVVQLVSGFIAGIMILGLVPDDSIDVNTVGALVVAAVFGSVFYGASAYRKHLHRRI